MSVIYVDAAALKDWCKHVLKSLGVTASAADVTGDVLVRSSLRGLDSHGISRMPMYVDKLRSGEVDGRAVWSWEWDSSLLRFDGAGGLGQAVATAAIEEAMIGASDYPVVTCLLRRTGHLAALGMFALQAAEAGLVCVMVQETPPLMAARGSRRPSIGNNPVAFAAPLRDRPPIVFDMSSSVASRGAVLQAKRENRPLDPGVAIGPDGEVTTSPDEALRGAMLPVGGHKGIGLAMLVQTLAGSLTASTTFDSAVTHSSTSSAGNVSAAMLLFDVDKIVGANKFFSHMDQWLDHYLSISPDENRYPGSRAAQTESERRHRGIPISDGLARELQALGSATGIRFDWGGHVCDGR